MGPAIHPIFHHEGTPNDFERPFDRSDVGASTGIHEPAD